MLAEKLTPKELVYKHIFDIHHVITEEELQSVEVAHFSTFEVMEDDNVSFMKMSRISYPDAMSTNANAR